MRFPTTTSRILPTFYITSHFSLQTTHATTKRIRTSNTIDLTRPISFGISYQPRVINMASKTPYLPPELWSIIIGYVRREELPACAAVCRNWQLEVEKYTFEKLFVRSSRLGNLHQCFTDERRQLLIRSLIFCIELPHSLDFGDSDPSIQDEYYDYFDEEVNDDEDEESYDEDSDIENDEEDALIDHDPLEETDEDRQSFQHLPDVYYLDGPSGLADLNREERQEKLNSIPWMCEIDEIEKLKKKEEECEIRNRPRQWTRTSGSGRLTSLGGPKWRCECHRPRKVAENNLHARECMVKLFYLMSRWKSERILEKNPSGIPLELTTASPNDEKHLPLNRFMGLRREHTISFGALANIPPIQQRPPTLGTHHHETYFVKPPLSILATVERMPQVPVISSFRISRRCFSDINEFSRLVVSHLAFIPPESLYYQDPSQRRILC